MGAAIGMALGLGLNALGGYAAEKAKQKEQEHSTTLNLLMNTYQHDPEGLMKFAGTPEGKKLIKNTFHDGADMFMALAGSGAQMRQQQQKDFAAMTGGQNVTGDKMPPLPQQGGVIQAGAKPGQMDGAGQGPTPQQRLATIDRQLQGARDFQLKYANDPSAAEFVKHAQDYEKELITERGQIQHDQEFQQNLQFHQQEHQDASALAQQNLQLRQQNAQIMQSIAASNMETNQQIKMLNANIAEGRAKEQTQRDFDSAKASLQKQFQAIVAAKTGGTNKPAMNAKQLDPLIARYNAQARALLARGKKAGVDFDPDEFQPIKADDITTHPWYTFGKGAGTTTTELSNADGGSAPAGGSTDLASARKNLGL